MLKLSDGRNFGRTFTGLCLIVGPLLFLISSIIAPDTDSKNKGRELAKVAAHKHAYIYSALLFLIAALVMIGAMIGLIHVFRGRRVGLGQIAASLLVMGLTVFVAFYAFTSVEYEMVNQKGIDRGAMATLLHKANNATSSVPFFVMFILGLALGLILLGIAIWRRGVAPKWAAALIVIMGPLTFFTNGKGAEIATNVILLVAFGALGLALLRMSDAEWDAPREQVGAPPAAPEPAPSPASAT